MLRLGFLLHFYQPSTQFPEVLTKINDGCYEPIVTLFEKFDEVPLTVNFTGSLLELWDKAGRGDLLRRWSKVIEKRGIDVVGSAMYHPLLFSLPAAEIANQIRLQENALYRYFRVSKPEGFFPPEMAYAKLVGETVAGLGYSWILVDGSGVPPDGGFTPDLVFNHTVHLKGLPLKVVFRHPHLSYRIAFGYVRTIEQLNEELVAILKAEDSFIVLALDAETFGWHRPYQLEFLESILQANRRGILKAKLMTISDISQLFPVKKNVEPLVSTWGQSGYDKEGQVIFPRWNNPDNPVHQSQWQLLNLAAETLRDEPEGTPLRLLLAKGEQSDQFWWAAGNPCWLPPMVEAGAGLLRGAILASPAARPEIKEKARSLAKEIMRQGFEKFGRESIGC
jgi:alpha-amylase/alpha-mannosidase (GH57 family)